VARLNSNQMDVSIGRRLKLRRLERSLSQARLGEFLGVSFQQIQKYEKGVNSISASRLHAIAGALDIDIGYFFERGALAYWDKRSVQATVLEKVGPDIADFVVSQEGIALNLAFRRLGNDKVRGRILAMIEALGSAFARRLEGEAGHRVGTVGENEAEGQAAGQDRAAGQNGAIRDDDAGDSLA